MRKKNDERFRFLNTWHTHHSYYEWRTTNGEPETIEEKKIKGEQLKVSRNEGLKIDKKR